MTETRSRFLAAAWLLLAAGAFLYYYRQAASIFMLGPRAWVQENYSLIAAWRALRDTGRSLAFPPELPFLGEALVRAGLAVLGAGLVLLAGQLFGQLILRLVRARLAPGEGVLYRTGLGLGGLSFLFLGMAFIGLYTPAAVLAVLVISALLSFAWGWHALKKNGFPQFRLRWSRRDWPWLVILAIAGAATLMGALAPEIEYDALWYHLWLPAQWLSAGRPVDIVSEYISLYPLTWDLLYGAAASAGGPVAAKLLHWACLPLIAGVAARLARRFFPGVSPALAAALVATTPSIFWEATTAYIDLALALYLGLAVYALLRYWQASSAAPTWLILAALNLGLALAVKHLALLAWVILVPAALVQRWRKTGSLSSALRIAGGLAGLSLLLPLPWYLRAWLASGNPFFPDLYSLFGALPPERWSPVSEAGLAQFKSRFGFPPTPLNLARLPWNLSMHAARFGGSLGPLFLILTSAAIFLRWKRRRFWALLAFVLAYLLLWASPLSSLQLRFILPLVPILAVLGASAYRRFQALLRRAGLPRQPLQAALALLLLLNLPPFLSLHEGDRQGNDGWLTHVTHVVPWSVVLGMESQEAYLSRAVPSYRAWQYANKNLPQEARVLTYSGGDHLYSARPRLWSDATLAHPGTWGVRPGQESQGTAYLSGLGITHVLVDRRQLESLSAQDLPLLAPGFRETWLALEYQDERFELYRLLPTVGESP